MDVSTPSRAARLMPSGLAGQRQRGDILLISLVFLLVCLLGVLIAMRTGLVDTFMAGNTLTRQKDVQVGDIALRQIESQMLAIYAGGPLEVNAASQPWYRDSPGAAAPLPAYWDTCLGNSSAASRCGSLTLAVNGNTLPYTVLVAVQATGNSDPYNCPLAGLSTDSSPTLTAMYYDVFIHVKESSGVTVANTETIYRLCVQT